MGFSSLATFFLEITPCNFLAVGHHSHRTGPAWASATTFLGN
jgi:hypothetical protein